MKNNNKILVRDIRDGYTFEVDREDLGNLLVHDWNLEVVEEA